MSSGSDTILAQLPSSAPDLVVDGRPDTTPDVIDGVAYARLYGEPLFRMPTDLYIPPDALEVFLETFEGPLDLLLYLIRKQNFNILDITMAPVRSEERRVGKECVRTGSSRCAL